MVDYPQKNACPFLQQGSVLVPPAHTNHPRRGVQSQARWGRRDSFSKASKWLQPRRSCSAGRTRAAAGQPGSAPQRARVPAGDEHTVPSHAAARRGEGNQASKGGRQEGPEFPGVAAPQCLSSSERRVKVFTLGIIIKDIWVLLSHALFFFVFLINCKPHPDC